MLEYYTAVADASPVSRRGPAGECSIAKYVQASRVIMQPNIGLVRDTKPVVCVVVAVCNWLSQLPLCGITSPRLHVCSFMACCYRSATSEFYLLFKVVWSCCFFFSLTKESLSNFPLMHESTVSYKGHVECLPYRIHQKCSYRTISITEVSTRSSTYLVS